MSENIFSSFYNKVLSFFQKDKDEKQESAKDTATNRLKLVLMQDRSNLDGATMQKMREQLISVISKYIEIDQDALDLNLESDGDEIALMLNIPVIRARTPEEIEELEKLEEENLKQEQESKDGENTDEDAENSDESDKTEESEESKASNESVEDDSSMTNEEEEEENKNNADSDTQNNTDEQEKNESEIKQSTENNEEKQDKKNKNK